MNILIVEDEHRLADSLAELLREEGFSAQVACDGLAGCQYALSGVYDLVILDIMLPGKDGLSVAKAVRAAGLGTPILMLTARSAVADRVAGLNAGADYYLPKPFDIQELLACVHTLLRRVGPQVNDLRLGNTTLDLATGILCTKQDSVRLSAKEFDIMRVLMESGVCNVSKGQLLVKVWGYDSNAEENHVEVYISFLRKKLACIGSDINICTIRRLGYHLEVNGPC